MQPVCCQNHQNLIVHVKEEQGCRLRRCHGCKQCCFNMMCSSLCVKWRTQTSVDNQSFKLHVGDIIAGENNWKTKIITPSSATAESVTTGRMISCLRRRGCFSRKTSYWSKEESAMVGERRLTPGSSESRSWRVLCDSKTKWTSSTCQAETE